MEHLHGYALSAYKELGREAINNAPDIVHDIIDTWQFHAEQPQPFILLVSGFQGSGKTTTVEELSKVLSFQTISSDQIRFILQAHISQHDLQFNPTIHYIRNSLIQVAAEYDQNIVVDQKITPERLNLIRRIIYQSLKSYTFHSVWLTSSKGTLYERVSTREPKPGKYQGTIEELTSTLATHTIDISRYNQVLNSSHLSPEEIAKSILPHIYSI